MNCMALELPCAPLGHILDMFSPRSMSPARARHIRCKFNGVYASSSGTPRLTAWSNKSSKEFCEESASSFTPSSPPSSIAEDCFDEETPCIDVGLEEEWDSGHSSESEDNSSPESCFTMPLPSETFETALLELKCEEEASKAEVSTETCLSDCSDDSYDFGVHTIYSESPTLDRSTSKSKECECSQICCKGNHTDSKDVQKASEETTNEEPFAIKRVRFADHVRIKLRSRCDNKILDSIELEIKSILKLSGPSEFH